MLFIEKLSNRIKPWRDIGNKIYNLHIKSKNPKFKFLTPLYMHLLYSKYNIIISHKSDIKGVINFPHPLGIVIGEGVIIGNNVTIYQNVTLGRKDKEINKYPIIGDNVTIYAGAKILGNVKIGNNAIVGANAVVLKDVPDNSIAVGVPAKILKNIE